MAKTGPLTGQVLAERWQVLDIIDSSNFGDVYEGRTLAGDGACAIKALRTGMANPGHLADFQTEGDLLELLAGSSNIITMLDRGIHGLQVTISAPGAAEAGAEFKLEVPYIVLELADASLADLIAHRHLLPWEDRLGLFRDVAKGVHQMHDRRIVNRDLKSNNALVIQSSARTTEAKVADLGRSSDTTAPPRVAPQIYDFMRGDPAFSAPELVWGLGNAHPDTARLVDLYLLGSVFFEFAVGVALTALAIPQPLQVMNSAAALSAADRQLEYEANLTQLRVAMEVGYGQFEAELPPAIREPASQLLRRLTDVNPKAREPRSISGRTIVQAWDLQWILRKIDTMRRLLEVSKRDAKRKEERSARRAKKEQTSTTGARS